MGELDESRFVESVLSECPAFARSEVVRLMPELEEPGDPRRPVEPNDGWRRQRLFDALRRLFAGVGQRRRVAVVVEDVHWADPTTLEFLDYLLAGRPARGLALVMTSRSEDSPSRGLTEWLERLRRDPRSSSRPCPGCPGTHVRFPQIRS